MAASGDANGTMIDVYPERTTLEIPDHKRQVVFGENPAPPRTWPFHVLLSVPREAEEVERIGAREAGAPSPRPRHAGAEAVLPLHRVLARWHMSRFIVGLREAGMP
jgi:hypothetical protein